MSSGRVQLASVGLQDDRLTGTPDVTYFIKKFNRHTKFALETLEVPFNQTTIDFGSWINVIVPRNGQLVRMLYIKLVLPPLSVGGYTNSIGNAIIEYADLLVGGQLIERINGEFMQIYNDTFISDSQQSAFEYMIGSTDNGLYGLGSATGYSAGVQQPAYGFYPRTFIVPLPFFFMRNEALSIPLCALTRSEIEIRVQLRPLPQVIAGGYVASNVSTTNSITWSIPPDYTANTVSPYFTTGPVTAQDQFSNVFWLSYSYIFAITPRIIGSTIVSNLYYYNFNTTSFVKFSNYFNFNIPGCPIGISQNNLGVTIIVTTSTYQYYTSGNTSSPPYFRSMISLIGLSGTFQSIADAVPLSPVNYIQIANDGTNFVAIGQYSNTTTYTLNSFSSPTFPCVSSGITTSVQLISITWSPGFQAFIIGDINGVMYSYKIGQSALNALVGPVGPYSAYSTTYGQIYNSSPVVASNNLISNVYYSSFDGGQTFPQEVPYAEIPNTSNAYATSIAYSPIFNQLFVLIVPPIMYYPEYAAYSIGVPQTSNTLTFPTQTGQFQASLAVEYVFLADEEVRYIQGAKIDYVITQIQLASVGVPSVTNSLNAYRLNFINPVKELFFLIQDSNVVQTNDYYNYYNTSSNSQQLVSLQLQFNGENNIDPTVADSLYLGDVQFLNNHTRVPNNGIYNYSFSIDPENYLPTGQVNMSRIMNQNLWINMTTNPNERTVRVYAVSYNIFRVQNGLGGCLFIDNNTSLIG
jgi:hypothetical protein